MYLGYRISCHLTASIETRFFVVAEADTASLKASNDIAKDPKADESVLEFDEVDESDIPEHENDETEPENDNEDDESELADQDESELAGKHIRS